jgi:uncharacterized membrane protein YjjB (DUF3815 family)
VREDLDRLLRDVTLVTLALAVATGWSLYQLAHGVATFVDGLFVHLPSGGGYYPQAGLGLTWTAGHRVITLDAILVGAIELALVLLAAHRVARRRPGV